MKRIAVALLLLAASLASQAEDAKVSREREALRRAQAALRAAQEQQSTLRTEKAAAEAAASAANKDAAAAKARNAASAEQLKSADARLETLREQLQAATRAHQDAAAKANDNERTLLQQLAALRQQDAARLQANQALTTLLERSTTALADAQQRNAQLQALGQDLVRRYTNRPVVDTALLGDPLVGLTDVRYEESAEQLRKEMDALRIKR